MASKKRKASLYPSVVYIERTESPEGDVDYDAYDNTDFKLGDGMTVEVAVYEYKKTIRISAKLVKETTEV